MKFLPSLLALVLLAPVTARADITPANVSTLVQQWELETGPVSGGPTLVDGTLYLPAWDSAIYALDPATGAIKWKASVGGPVTGAVDVTDDGGICYGTLSASAGCVDADDGEKRWEVSVREPAPGAIWSGVKSANGRLFVGVASLSDSPCTRGRLVALDLADGHELWRFNTVPEKVCSTDTAQECDGELDVVDGDCPAGGKCVLGIGGGVTATVALDPTGEWVYMNTVGCYTSPSIGESDSMFKIAAATGDVTWRNRVNAPEQYGSCKEDESVDCGNDAHCAGVGGTCWWSEGKPKSFYHDFGFLNGPLYLDLPAEDGHPAQKLIVSASKNGTLYAFDEADGDIVWKNEVQPTPITPGFAGFGLFNGAIMYADGRIHAALNQLYPSNMCDNGNHLACSTDADCTPGKCVLEPPHLMAFDVRDGSVEWSAEIGRSWSSVGVYNGVVYSGKNGAGDFFAHDAATGELLHTFELPGDSSARALVAGDTLYATWGVTAPGGVRAYGFCGNGILDAGEACDPAIAGTVCCAATCQPATSGTCDDGDVCSADDQCVAGTCQGTIATVEQVTCSLDELETAPCGDETLPRALGKLISKRMKRTRSLLAKAAALAGKGKTDKAAKMRAVASKQVTAIARKAAKATKVASASKRLSEECFGTIDALVTSRRALIDALQF